MLVLYALLVVMFKNFLGPFIDNKSIEAAKRDIFGHLC